MIGPELLTKNTDVLLIAPDVERDSPNGVRWLLGPAGRETLSLMRVTNKNNVESNLVSERTRITKMIESSDELAWMIKYGGRVVGVIEVHLTEDTNIAKPRLSFMIGDPADRRRGIGGLASEAVITYLFEELRETDIYARHLTRNLVSSSLLTKMGFLIDSVPYTDVDGLEWQNMKLNRMDWLSRTG